MFIPRHPVVENQFCSYGESSSYGTAGVGGVICYAGAVMWLDCLAANEEAIVYRYNTNTSLTDKYGIPGDPTVMTDEEKIPFGFAMQKVKVGYHQVHPTGFSMPGDLGSSDAIAQPLYSGGDIVGHKSVPLAIAHNGIWDTVHYCSLFTGTAGTDAVAAELSPGENLYVAANSGGRVTGCAAAANNDTYDGEALNLSGSDPVTTVVARVVKGASIAKVSANINNTTLYAIRIKLLI